jgi:hypothetical protein
MREVICTVADDGSIGIKRGGAGPAEGSAPDRAHRARGLDESWLADVVF